MMQTKFKVGYPKKDIPITILIFLVIEALLIKIIVPQIIYPIIAVIFYIFFTVLFFFVILSVILFHVKVDESDIKVRTRFGRRFEFNCSDIEKVDCYKSNNAKYGATFNIRILTKSHEVEIGHTMANFRTMAGYILEKLEAGEIKQTSVSDICKRKLVKCKNGDMLQKKQKQINEP